MNKHGLVQGCPLSPLLSNLFLNDIDKKLEFQKYSFIRFSDDLNIYAPDENSASACFIYAEQLLSELNLKVNKKKSGIYMAMRRTFLGQEFWSEETSGKIFARRKQPDTIRYNNWHKSAIQKIDRNYHLIQDGILSKQDYTLLFENENGKKYLPIETMDSLNIYSNIIFSSGFFEFVNKKKFRVAMFNKYGRNIGTVFSSKHGSSSKTMLKQASLYLDSKRRLSVAKLLIIASMQNIRANVRYYYKITQSEKLKECIQTLSNIVTEMNETNTIEQLMLVEARGHQTYYKVFNEILKKDSFHFVQRTKRPPKDPINALISFGNVFIYNRLATEIHKTSLDIRIGILHATNNRSESLNLDIAELFKPIIVDRAIFTLINKNMITANDYFESTDEGGIYLNKLGKKLFIEMLEEKLYQKVKYQNTYTSYDTLMRKEIQKILRYVLYQEKYKPYKYIL